MFQGVVRAAMNALYYCRLSHRQIKIFVGILDNASHLPVCHIWKLPACACRVDRIPPFFHCALDKILGFPSPPPNLEVFTSQNLYKLRHWLGVFTNNIGGGRDLVILDTFVFF